MRLTIFRGVFVVVACAMLVHAPAEAAINLELRPANSAYAVGETIELGLYAVSDSAAVQTLSAAQVIITWDIAYVQLLGLTNDGAVTLLSSSFGPEPYGLNTSLTDGNAMWIGWAQLGGGNAVPATPTGTLLTTFLFAAQNLTAPSTLINIPPTGGNGGQTKVFHGSIPNTNIVGELSGATVIIKVFCPEDIDHNHMVDIDDLLAVINHWGPCPPVCIGDVDQNSTVDIDDLLAVITAWGMCP